MSTAYCDIWGCETSSMATTQKQRVVVYWVSENRKSKILWDTWEECYFVVRDTGRLYILKNESDKIVAVYNSNIWVKAVDERGGE